MILGIGLDLCEIGRIARAVGRERFLERVYTQAERSRIAAAGKARRGEIAAGLFAAKEAVSKALGTGFRGFGFADVEIVPDAGGRPACTLHGGADKCARRLGGEGYRVLVSITHESGTAAATAILEGWPDIDYPTAGGRHRP